MRYRSFIKNQKMIAQNVVKFFGREGEPQGGTYEDGKESGIFDLRKARSLSEQSIVDSFQTL